MAATCVGQRQHIQPQQQQPPCKAWSDVLAASGPQQLLHTPLAGLSCANELALQRPGALLLPLEEPLEGEGDPWHQPLPQHVPSKPQGSHLLEVGASGAIAEGCASETASSEHRPHAGSHPSTRSMQRQACTGDAQAVGAAEHGAAAAAAKGPPGQETSPLGNAPASLQHAGTSPVLPRVPDGSGLVDRAPVSSRLGGMGEGSPAASGQGLTRQLVADSPALDARFQAGAGAVGQEHGRDGPSPGDMTTGDSWNLVGIDSGMLTRVLAEMEAEGLMRDASEE